MSGTTGSTTDVREIRPRSATSWIGTLVCAVILVLGHFVTGYFVLIAYMIEPDGSWDKQAVTNSNFAAGIALALTVVTALLSWLFVKAGWLRRWWFVLPALLAIVAILRLTLLAPEL
ncbi:hypothetical protein OG741_17705 [Streptomyces sp. NBC_01410]|uniref:hypothetical protein n=1 Tax=Streptomyces sp. NBC_01410 TaxID=2903856 RepID=UPI003248741A